MAKAKAKSGGSAAARSDEGSEQAKFASGDVVLGKIKGYPPWPGILVEEDNVPKASVLSQRPGKTFLIVRFFPAADYGFNKPHELKRLSKREIEAFLADPHKRNAELRQAYQLAQDPMAWNNEQNENVRKAEEEGDEEEEEEDMLAEDGAADEEDEDIKSAAKKKRKAPEAKPAAKKQKTEVSKPVKATASSAADSSPLKKSEAAVEHDAEEQELDPETRKVKSWRHSLQRGFLNKEGVVNAADMEHHDRTMKQVEDYTGITATQLRLTKIGKVMKRITQLSEIPRDEEFRIRERAQRLCDIWTDIFAGKPRESDTGVAPAAEANGNGSTHANGVVQADATAAGASSTNGIAAPEENPLDPQKSAAAQQSSEDLQANIPPESNESEPPVPFVPAAIESQPTNAAPLPAQEPPATPVDSKAEELSTVPASEQALPAVNPSAEASHLPVSSAAPL